MCAILYNRRGSNVFNPPPVGNSFKNNEIHHVELRPARRIVDQRTVRINLYYV